MNGPVIRDHYIQGSDISMKRTWKHDMQLSLVYRHDYNIPMHVLSLNQHGCMQYNSLEFVILQSVQHNYTHTIVFDWLTIFAEVATKWKQNKSLLLSLTAVIAIGSGLDSCSYSF